MTGSFSLSFSPATRSPARGTEERVFARVRFEEAHRVLVARFLLAEMMRNGRRNGRRARVCYARFARWEDMLILVWVCGMIRCVGAESNGVCFRFVPACTRGNVIKFLYVNFSCFLPCLCLCLCVCLCLCPLSLRSVCAGKCGGGYVSMHGARVVCHCSTYMIRGRSRLSLCVCVSVCPSVLGVPGSAVRPRLF